MRGMAHELQQTIFTTSHLLRMTYVSSNFGKVASLPEISRPHLARPRRGARGG